ncbi:MULTISPECIES: glycine cleavage system aminomethyltransferase GcvT [unclassified Thermotoga]|uniref:glycine cleavage system aminomethyltransferase GcvT n=1 Tax=unclassified Thermotoga TaxID=2631113 RepID=UPI000280E9B1|nr:MULTISPECIES: glycine cleavage system aminomethyltransferase GcvT [unclassified Thermotoga]AIY86294.1 glycine cleavage system aminomethyltransferase T [Thermotoga sp. 2812B]EJX26230.1 glycine cleavage system aminomethyltransferase T [Thermotoga sp. EMP]
MKRTPLFEKHVGFGAKMVDFAGWEMPLYYTSIFEEVMAVRKSVGMFDVSHMGEFLVKGPEAVSFIDFLITNDFSSLPDGKAIYSVMCNENGGIIDDLVVYKVSPDEALMVVNAANIEKDFNWIKSHSKNFDVEVSNISDTTALIAFQGPKAQETLQELVEDGLEEIAYYSFRKSIVAGVEALVSRTGYTGEDGFELMLEAKNAPKVWDALMNLLRKIDGRPAGLGARDVCRLEATYLLYGQDMDESTNPFEVGLSWVVKLDKNFVGKEALLKAKEKVERKLVALELSGKRIARKGYEVSKNGERVGEITSGNFSPTLGKSIALALVSKSVKVGDQLEVVFPGGKLVEASVVKKPFYRGSVRREV